MDAYAPVSCSYVMDSLRWLLSDLVAASANGLCLQAVIQRGRDDRVLSECADEMVESCGVGGLDPFEPAWMKTVVDDLAPSVARD